MTEARLFLCTDLDRTLLPNGLQPESPGARDLFARLVDRPEVTLAYVTGRHRALVEQAIGQYALPWPDFAITDVGTRIHTRNAGDWRVWPDWEAEIAVDWADHDHADLRRLFQDIGALRLQETEKQNTHKLSYYLSPRVDRRPLVEEMQRRLNAAGVAASLVWSIDETADIGLLDVLPKRATKLHAVDFLRARLGLTVGETLFAGDSGNDLEVMAGGLPSVLVANAADEVRDAALERARRAGNEDTLFLARGGFLGMNGNYSAGILEGVAHFRPELAPWIEAE